MNVLKVLKFPCSLAMGHLSLSNLMKRETSKMTKLLLQDPERPNQ